MTLDNRKITKELTNKIKTTYIKNSAASLSACTLCPRNCKADRNSGKTGFCGVDSTIYLARAALHMWEEPCISGKKVPVRFSSQDVDFGAASARIMILPLEAEDFR